jgi:selenocysteine lyase/cysteine desulfurase
MNNYEKFYTDFNQANPTLIHMAGHSHHYWPDITKEAILNAYNDAKEMVDLKWDKIFGEVLPHTQKLMAEILKFPRPKDIAFAPNTHELLVRVLSVFPNSQKKRILTTKHEFHSADRQFRRLAEESDYEIDFVETEEIVTKLKSNSYDLIYVSHVFFDSGLILAEDILQDIIKLKDEALFLLDGYHSFCALPLDLSPYADELFYLSGSYKYAQAGEGLCFMTMPNNCKLRPANTGWFASFETLESKSSQIEYSDNGFRFSGATRDFTPHYRFNAIWDNFLAQEITINEIHKNVQHLQASFIQAINTEKLICSDLTKVGHFLTFKTEGLDHSRQLYEELKSMGILTDFRGNSLRFGFGMHLTLEKINECTKKLLKIPFFS